MKTHWTDRAFPYIFFGVLALIVVGICAECVANVTGNPLPCSYYGSVEARRIPARCLKEFGITPIIVPR